MRVLIEHKFGLIYTRRTFTDLATLAIFKEAKPLADGTHRHHFYATTNKGKLIEHEITGKDFVIYVNQSEQKPEKSDGLIGHKDPRLSE